MGSELEVRDQQYESRGLDGTRRGSFIQSPKCGRWSSITDRRMWMWNNTTGSGRSFDKTLHIFKGTGSLFYLYNQTDFFPQLFCSRLLPGILEPLHLFLLSMDCRSPAWKPCPASLWTRGPGSCGLGEPQELLEVCVHSGVWTAAAFSNLHTGEPETVDLKPPVKLPCLLTSKPVKEEKNCRFSLRNNHYCFFFSSPQ